MESKINIFFFFIDIIIFLPPAYKIQNQLFLLNRYKWNRFQIRKEKQKEEDGK